MGGAPSKFDVKKEVKISKDNAIVVVGGGPAGIHMACSLGKEGFTNITVLEAEPEIGGKSFTFFDKDGIPHEMGTCYLHNLYGPIRELIAEYDSGNVEIGLSEGKDFHEVFGTDLREGVDGDFTNGLDYSAFMLQKAEEATAIPPGYYDYFPDWLQYPFMLSDFKKYIYLHHKIFGKYEYGLPPQPSSWKEIDMTAYQFLERNRLLSLEGLMRYIQQFQGYGVLEDIHAFYLLWWIHPDLLSNLIKEILKGKPGVDMLSNGYQSLWLKMAKFHSDKGQIKIIRNAKVKSVTRGNEKQVVYQLEGSSETTTMKFDTVVMAINLSIFQHIVTDLTDTEKMLFSSYNHSVLATTLYEADPVSHEHAVEYWFSRMRPDAGRDGLGVEGRLHGQRNSRLALKGKDAEPVDRERRITYQYLDRALKDETDPEMLKDQLLSDLHLAGESNVEILLQKPWPYFPKFNAKALKYGNLWHICSIQGNNDTLWIGSSVCFESVLDCVQYNKKLISRIH